MDKRISIVITKERPIHHVEARSGGVTVASASHKRKSVAIQLAHDEGVKFLNRTQQPAPRIAPALLALAEVYAQVTL
jgi:hypothetical protein